MPTWPAHADALDALCVDDRQPRFRPAPATPPQSAGQGPHQVIKQPLRDPAPETAIDRTPRRKARWQGPHAAPCLSGAPHDASNVGPSTSALHSAPPGGICVCTRDRWGRLAEDLKQALRRDQRTIHPSRVEHREFLIQRDDRHIRKLADRLLYVIRTDPSLQIHIGEQRPRLLIRTPYPPSPSHSEKE